MALVKDMLSQKENLLWTISCQASVKDALSLMAEKKIGALIAIDAGYLVGVFSERDYARKAITTPGSAAWDIASPNRLWRRSTAKEPSAPLTTPSAPAPSATVRSV
jgi:CBS-domain-containing membrane protein